MSVILITEIALCAKSLRGMSTFQANCRKFPVAPPALAAGLLNVGTQPVQPGLRYTIPHPMKLHHRLSVGLLLAAAVPALADIKINDNLTISGYAAGSYEHFSNSPGPTSDSLFNGAKDTPSADALKTNFAFTFKPVTANISLFYIPNIPTGAMKNELTILDA